MVLVVCPGELFSLAYSLGGDGSALNGGRMDSGVTRWVDSGW